MWIDKPISVLSMSLAPRNFHPFLWSFLEFSIILGFVFLTRRSLLSIDDIGQGNRHLSFSFFFLSFSYIVTSVSFYSYFKWKCFNRTRNSIPREGKNWLVLFFLLSSNRFHQPLVYKCLCLCAPPWVSVHCSLCTSICTVILSVLKVLFSLLSDWLSPLFSLSRSQSFLSRVS